MNAKQKGVLFLGALAIVAMLLFPPWTVQWSRYQPGRSLGYGWIGQNIGYSAAIDWARLALQILAVAIVAAVAAYSLRSTEH